MNTEIITGYSLWYVPICLLLGAIYAGILYYKETKNEYGVFLRWVLASLRTLFVAIIAFLLLNPIVKSLSSIIEKPIIIFAQDNSNSILINKDSAFYQNDYLSDLDNFLNEIDADFDLKKYLFGDHITNEFEINFNDQRTNISGLLEEVSDRYSNRNVGALIIATDGNYNYGMNPLYSSTNNDFPIFTVALGDTLEQRDLMIRKANFNRLVYQGNEFPIQVILYGTKCDGLKSKLTVLKGEKEIFSQKIEFTSDNYIENIDLKIEAKEKGLQRYRIKLSHVNNEITYSNNVQDIFVDVIEGRQKILILSNSPHPDVSAIKQTLISNRNYEVDDVEITKFEGQTEEYNLIILHGLPSRRNNIQNILSSIENSKIPVLYIISQQTDLKRFNLLKSGVSISGEKILFNEAQPLFNGDFKLFSLNDQTLDIVTKFPPLIAPFGNIIVQNSVTPLFFQRIESIGTRTPLFAINKTFETKFGIITGSGIWKWKMIDYAENGNYNSFYEVLNKIIQYLSVKEDRGYFRVYLENNFTESEEIVIDAEVYNKSYELVSDAIVSINIFNEEGKQFPFEFSKTSSSFYLNAGSLSVGQYRYIAKAVLDDMTYSDKGEFTITSLNLEDINPVADHNLIYNLAVRNGGQMFYPNQFEELIDNIHNREEITNVSKTQKKLTELINFYWIMILVLGLISLEWFMRKRAGGY